MAVQKNIRETIIEILAICCPTNSFSHDKSLVSQGLNSLSATRFALEVESKFDVVVAFESLGTSLTINEIISDIRSAPEDKSNNKTNGKNQRSIDGANDSTELPLLPLQQSYLVTSDPSFTNDAVGCHIYREFELTDVKAADLVDAWKRLNLHHKILTAHSTEMGTLKIGSPTEIELNNATNATHDTLVTKRRDMWKSRINRIPNSLIAVALVSSPKKVTIQLSVDGLILDGHGLILLLEQWRQLALNRNEILASYSISLAHCISLLSQPYSKKDLKYWDKVMEQAPPGPFTQQKNQSNGNTKIGEIESPIIRRSLMEKLSSLEWKNIIKKAKEMGISPSSLVFANFCEVILEMDGHTTASFILTTSERPRLPNEAQKIVGPFTSSMVVPANKEHDELIDEFSIRLHKEIWNHLQHNAVPAVVALRNVAEKAKMEKGLPVVFTSLLGIQTQNPEFSLRPSYALSQTSGVALDHQMWEDAGELVIQWDVADGQLPPFMSDICFSLMLNRLKSIGISTTPGSMLNKLQQAYLVNRMMQHNRGSGDRNAVFSFEMEGIDEVHIRRTWCNLVKNYQVLRSIVQTDGSIRILDNTHLKPMVSVTLNPVSGLRHSRKDLDQLLLNRIYPLGCWPMHSVHLLIAPNGAGSIHISFDLVLLDGKSIHNIVSFFIRNLMELPKTVELSTSFQKGQTDKIQLTIQHEYWISKMKGLPSGPETKRNTSQGNSIWRRLSTKISGYNEFAKICRKEGLAPDIVLLSSFAQAWYPEVKRNFTIPYVCWRKQDDELRPAEMSQMAWVVYAHDVEDSSQCSSLFKTIKNFSEIIDRDLLHGGVDGLSYVGSRIMQERNGASTNKSSVLFSLPVVYSELVEWGELPGKIANSLQWVTKTPDVSLDAVSLSINDKLILAWDVIEDDYAKGVIARVFDRYVSIVKNAVQNPKSIVERRNVVDKDYLKIIDKWNYTKQKIEKLEPVHLQFEAKVLENPNHTAVYWRDGTWTFDELNEYSNKIARLLQSLGVSSEHKVAIAINRGPEMVAATLAILKTGGVYVPIEPSQPKERAVRILQIADCDIVLTTSSTSIWTLPDDIKIISVDKIPLNTTEDCINLDVVNNVDSTAYIIFTSGSTGEPKGVAVNHRSLQNLFQWCQNKYQFGLNDVGLCVTSLGFDLSVFDILGLLGFGSGIYVANAEEQRDPMLLADILIQYPITFWNSAPTTLDHIRPYFSEIDGLPEANRLRLVFLSGDYTPLSLPNELKATFPRVKLISLGGATEATVWSNFFEVAEVDPSWRSIPYGKPIDNARYYILDKCKQPCPIGIEGDLYIAGGVLSMGYYNQPEITSRQFVSDPFVTDKDAKMYHTGDRALYKQDGVISFQGRIDTQVKIRGVRIELEEIEYAIRQHSEIIDSVVIPQTDSSGDPKLVAYILSDHDLSRREVIDFVETKLPDSMVPKFVHIMERFPATNNGKLDRGAFPWPLINHQITKKQTDTTDSLLHELIEELQELIERLLGSKVNIDSDLWDQGLTSFTMMQISAALRTSRGVRVKIEWLVNDPTISGMAKNILTNIEPEKVDKNTVEEDDKEKEPTKEIYEKEIVTSTPEITRVNLLDKTAKLAFFESKANIRKDLSEASNRIRLTTTELPQDWLKWRSTHRSFEHGIVPLKSLAELLRLLSSKRINGKCKYFYPSSGETYSVQVYLWIKEGRVENISGGYYYFNSENSELIRVGSTTELERSTQFYYNRTIFDGSALALFLVGERKGIEPLYGEEAQPMLLLEAGYMGQLLMLGQYNSALGICPIGTFNSSSVEKNLALSDTHVMLHSFLIGPVVHKQINQDVIPPLSITQSHPDNSYYQDKINSNNKKQISIVGHAVRYPGIDSPEILWATLTAGKSHIRPAPVRRGLNKRSSMNGGFLDEIDVFDPRPFSIAPSDANIIDPQCRLLLEVVWECLERAGHSSQSLQYNDERVGVYVGHLWQDYRQVGIDNSNSQPNVIAAAGSEIANRISHSFGFTGPSIAVDTSCSSALTALHLAYSAIISGECSSAVVCAVNILTHPSHEQVLNELNLIAQKIPEGAYDNNTTGWVVGEGGGALLLRSSTSYLANSDSILAIVESTNVEHIGNRNSFGIPSSEAIQSGLTTVLKKAELKPRDIDYVECAASGASISDAAEWDAITNIFTNGIRIGTLKPNIGHLEAASGMSQISKALLQFEHKMLAPTRLSSNLSTLIDTFSTSTHIVQKTESFDTNDSPKRILINAVGATGSLSQVILTSVSSERSVADSNERVDGPMFLLLSAQSKEQLKTLITRYINALSNYSDDKWQDICATTQLSRKSHLYRLTVETVGCGLAQQALRNYLSTQSDQCITYAEIDPRLTDQVSRTRDSKIALKDWLLGYQVDWSKLWTGQYHRLLLPTYPFRRHNYWIEQDKSLIDTDGQKEYYLDLVSQAYSSASEMLLTDLNPHVPLEQYGLSSQIATKVVKELNQHLNDIDLPGTLLYEHRDLSAVARYLSGLSKNSSLNLSKDNLSNKTQLSESTKNRYETEHKSRTPSPISIVGLAGRYPQASNVEDLWLQLLEGNDLVAEMSANRLNDQISLQKIHGAFLDDVSSFDLFLFGITPNDALRMDPQERLLLEVVWEALEDACYPPSRMKSDLSGQVGVYIGAMHNEYPLLGNDLSTPDHLIDAGATPAGIANRISYHLGLYGPSLTVDTMCSSSLTALHLAVEALRAGQIQQAIVGGSNLSLHINKYVQQARLGMTSSDYRCNSFGAGSDGFIPGEGVGVIVLKALDKAEQAQDRIHGVIRGAAINHGGKVNGFTVPNPHAQKQLIQSALRNSGIQANTISYVEAHGTGTALGDPIETRALIEGMGLDDTDDILTIGSIKSNLGHLEAAAGIAGVTKVLLQMRHKVLVSSLHSTKPNPDINWQQLHVPQEPEPWEPRKDLESNINVWRAGVSAFGAGGANAHVILEAFDQPPITTSNDSKPQILVLSAATDESLIGLAQRLVDYLQGKNRDAHCLSDIAATLQLGREALTERWVSVCNNLTDAIQQLQAFIEGEQVGFRGRSKENNESIDIDRRLDEVAANWVKGVKVKWAPLNKHNRRLVPLPSYYFSRMHCWINNVTEGVSNADVTHFNVDTKDRPYKLVERVWRPTININDNKKWPFDDSEEIICFITPHTKHMGEELVKRLKDSHQIQIINIDQWESILTKNINNVAAVVLLGDLSPTAGNDSWREPFEACRHLIRISTNSRLHILHLVSGIHGPSIDRQNSDGALLAGLLYGLSAERTKVVTTILDVGLVNVDDPESYKACLNTVVTELIHQTPGDICVTQIGRLVPKWEVVTPTNEKWLPNKDALYLITGGTKGIGARLAKELVLLGVRLLALVGRYESTETNLLIDEFRHQSVTVDVHYGSVDDHQTMDNWLMVLENSHGPVAGIFHCAGVSSLSTGSLLEVPLDDIDRVATPKVNGLRALLPVIRRSQPEVIVSFSSISTVVPDVSVGVGDYAAVNKAMEYLSDQNSRHGFPTLKTVAWPVWENSNAGEVSRNTMKRCGLPILTDEQAFSVLWSTISTPGYDQLTVVDSSLLALKDVPKPINKTVIESKQSTSESINIDWLVSLVAKRINMPVDRMDPFTTFAELGIESIMLGKLVEDIEKIIGQPVAPGLLLEHPTIEKLNMALANEGAVLPDSVSKEIINNKKQEKIKNIRLPKNDKSKSIDSSTVAVIGMSVRFPEAPSTSDFWDLLSNGKCAIKEVPSTRWSVDSLFDPQGSKGSSISRWGGFLDDIEKFDAKWFKMSDEEARCLDPAIRLFLESTEGCIRDAGREPEELHKKKVGVFVGARLGDYRLRVGLIESELGLGTDQNFIAARVAHHYDLRGPNFVVDSACSSSLTAVHLACHSIISGESELAFAGGVDVLLDEAVYVQFTKARALSRTGKCRTFDKDADGFVPGEGCGVFLLKRLDNALKDGDRIIALIEGSAVNNDGRTMGLTTPNPEAQRDVVTSALSNANRSSHELGLIEAHGTATMIGDPIEFRALNEVFRNDSDDFAFCAIGSVKSNIGHLLSAAGIAGLAKAILSVQHGIIPATLFCDTPNPRFDLLKSPFYIPTKSRRWVSSNTRVAGVSAFGLGGTNAHIIVSEAPEHTPQRIALSPPIFSRHRLWIDSGKGSELKISEETLALLDLNFVNPSKFNGSKITN